MLSIQDHSPGRIAEPCVSLSNTNDSHSGKTPKIADEQSYTVNSNSARKPLKIADGIEL